MLSGNEITIADHVTLIVCERLVPGKMAIFRSVLGACTRKPPGIHIVTRRTAARRFAVKKNERTKTKRGHGMIE